MGLGSVFWSGIRWQIPGIRHNSLFRLALASSLSPFARKRLLLSLTTTRCGKVPTPSQYRPHIHKLILSFSNTTAALWPYRSRTGPAPPKHQHDHSQPIIQPWTCSAHIKSIQAFPSFFQCSYCSISSTLLSLFPCCLRILCLCLCTVAAVPFSSCQTRVLGRRVDWSSHVRLVLRESCEREGKHNGCLCKYWSG